MKQWNSLAASRRKRLARGLSVTGRIAPDEDDQLAGGGHQARRQGLY
ncbi:MAG: hypothetical protein JWM42_4116 [Burkholderia sp.]|jgi:hypothetical protein|nr:hypothetical protein [Burkholderia sp.]